MELEKQIFDEVVKRCDLDLDSIGDVDYDTCFFDRGDGQPNLGMDSIDALELVTLLYDTWQIDVPTEDMKKLYSVNAIAQYIREFKKD